MSVIHLYLARHGRCDSPARHPEVEHLPDGAEIGPLGRVEAMRLMGRLRHGVIGRVVASDMERARQTGHVLAHGLGLPLEIDSRLREWRVPTAIIGRVPAEYPARYRKWLAARAQDPDTAFEDGESLAEVIVRLRSWREELVSGTPDGGCVLAVTHYYAGRLFAARELAGDDAGPGMLYSIAEQLRFAHGAVSHLRTGSGRERMLVRTWNDRHHLDKDPTLTQGVAQ